METLLYIEHFLCLFLPHSCCRPSVSLFGQPFGRTTQVQEGVGQRHEVHRCVRWYQPRQCCILSQTICFSVVFMLNYFVIVKMHYQDEQCYNPSYLKQQDLLLYPYQR